MNLGTKTKLNGLGKVVENSGLKYAKIARHLHITTQATWTKMHKPYKADSIKLSFYKKIALLLEIPTDELIKKVIEAESGKKNETNRIKRTIEQK